MYNHSSQYGGFGHSSTTGSPTGPGGHRINIMGRMDEMTAVGLLQHLGKEDLQQLMNDDSKLSDLVQDLNQVRQVQSEHDSLVAQNKSLAEYNLSLQPRLDSLKTEVATLYETVNKLKTDLGLTKSRLDQTGSGQKLDTVHALLQTAAAEADESTEQLATRLCDEEMSVEDFLATYIPGRKQAHLRRIKAEKMGELLREAGQSSTPWPAAGPTGPGAVPLPYPTGGSAPYPTGGSAPYPTGGSAPYPVSSGFGMPDPSLYRP